MFTIVSTKTKFKPGEELELLCNNKNQAIQTTNNKKVTCGADRNWIVPDKISCKDTCNVNNIQDDMRPALVDYFNKVVDNEKVMISTELNVVCRDPDYSIRGIDKLYCQPDMTWSTPNATCLKNCPYDLPKITNAKVATRTVRQKYSFGDRIHYKCDKGFAINHFHCSNCDSYGTVTCTADGHWSNTLFECSPGCKDPRPRIHSQRRLIRYGHILGLKRYQRLPFSHIGKTLKLGCRRGFNFIPDNTAGYIFDNNGGIINKNEIICIDGVWSKVNGQCVRDGKHRSRTRQVIRPKYVHNFKPPVVNNKPAYGPLRPKANAKVLRRRTFH